MSERGETDDDDNDGDKSHGSLPLSRVAVARQGRRAELPRYVRLLTGAAYSPAEPGSYPDRLLYSADDPTSRRRTCVASQDVS